jgi:potassium channel subfamily K
MMARQYGADLFIGTRGAPKRTPSGILRKRSSLPPKPEQSEDSSSFSTKESLGKLASLRAWRDGVTGRMQFSVKTKDVDEELQLDAGHGTYETHPSEDIIAPESALVPTPSQESPDCDYEIKLDSPDGYHSKLQSAQISNNLPDKLSPRQSSDNTECPNELDSNKPRKRTLLCLEIEKCVNLKTTLPKLSAINPIILIRLNGKEIGRTPALKNTYSPIWYDELFEFPICHNCKVLSLEVWDAVSVTANSMNDWEFIGQCAVNIFDLVACAKRSDEHFRTHTLELKKWRNMEKDRICDERPSCHCPSSGREMKGYNHHSISGNHISDPLRRSLASWGNHDRSKTIHIKRPTGIARSFRKKRLDSIIVKRPDGAISGSSMFKIDNPDPFRRKDIREFKESNGHEPFYSSTSFKALSLILGYMSFGVLGFSCVFERWSLRDSIYFSVVTFTTVGYGDIRPGTQGGKLFSCLFAFMGIGIIGIALGYVGQTLIQAKVTALQTSPQSDESDDAQNLEKDENILPTEPNPLFLELRRIVSFFLPLTAMVAIGSFIVGYIEDWTWVDSFYWCVMTGTSVGYGDFYPKTTETIWFCIFFIPISVGLMSAALGRIANIFVEREIRKANTKFLHREVTLEDLEAMNADGNGDVSPLEFVEHMLLVMNKVDQQLLNDLHAQFERLDADGSGGLQQDDLEILTERKLTEYRSRALKEYEENILDQSALSSTAKLGCPQIVPS